MTQRKQILTKHTNCKKSMWSFPPNIPNILLLSSVLSMWKCAKSSSCRMKSSSLLQAWRFLFTCAIAWRSMWHTWNSFQWSCRCHRICWHLGLSTSTWWRLLDTHRFDQGYCHYILAANLRRISFPCLLFYCIYFNCCFQFVIYTSISVVEHQVGYGWVHCNGR